VCVCVCACVYLCIRECKMPVRRFDLWVWGFRLSKWCSSVCMFPFVISLPTQLQSCSHYAISKRSVNRHTVPERNMSEERWDVPLITANVVKRRELISDCRLEVESVLWKRIAWRLTETVFKEKGRHVWQRETSLTSNRNPLEGEKERELQQIDYRDV